MSDEEKVLMRAGVKSPAADLTTRLSTDIVDRKLRPLRERKDDASM